MSVCLDAWVQLIWRNGVAVIPLAMIVWAVTQWGARRPATRHALWLGALSWLVAAVFLPPMEFDEPGNVAFDGSADATAVCAVPPMIEPAVDDIELTISAAEPQSAIGDERFESGANESQFDPTEAIALVAPGAIRAGAFNDDPTPPTTIARSDRRALSHPNAAREPGGQSSTFGFHVPAAEPVFENTGATMELVPMAESVGLFDSIFSTDVAVQDSPVLLPEQTSLPFAVTAAVDPAEAVEPPICSDAPPACDETAAVASTDVRWGWIGPWVRLRDAVGGLPSLPPYLWCVVAGLLLLARIVACLRLKRQLRRARPASPQVQALVDRCATSIGVTAGIRTVFLSDRVSPMIVCSWRPLLVLPVRLWRELDMPGRRAVVLHELAHLKRRDHWTHWFESAMGIVYWWHPVVWWMRHRLREEAENACDAWVTWFEPRQRRAYAAALVQAQRFLCERRVPAPIPAVGVVSPRTRHFARRLTMVMTQRVSPRASSFGLLALPLMFFAAWTVVPAHSVACPPSEESHETPVETQRFIHGRILSDADSFVVFVGEDGMKLCQQGAPKKVAGKHTYGPCTIYVADAVEIADGAELVSQVAIDPSIEEIVVFPTAEPRGVEVVAGAGRPAPYNKATVSINGRTVHLDAGPSIGEVFYTTKAAPGTAAKDVRYAVATTAPEEIVTLEFADDASVVDLHTLAAMERDVAVASRDGARPRVGAPVARSRGGANDPDARIERLERRLEELTEKMAILTERLAATPTPPPAPVIAQRFATPVAPAVPVAPGGVVARSMVAPQGETVRRYELPEGKREALTKLMVRSDVPIRVRALPNGIEVHANEADQAKFAGFVAMISGEGMDHQKSYAVSEGKLEALTELMSRDDVPVLVVPGDEGIGVRGGELVQKTFRDFIEMIDPKVGAWQRGDADAVAHAGVLQYRAAAEHAARLAELEAAAASARGDAKEAAKRLKELKGSELEAQAEMIEEHADRLIENAEQLREQAEALAERMENSPKGAADDLRAAMDRLRLEAKNLEEHAAALYKQAAELEAQAEAKAEARSKSAR